MKSSSPKQPVDAFYDDTAYDLVPAEEFEPAPGEILHLDSFTKDVICTKCGTWKTEHDWDLCSDPNYV